jgi:hypothetical protein
VSAPDGRFRAVDRAALLGAALAAIVALTFAGEGEWDWMATAAGVALLTVLAAFFRLPTGSPRRAVELAAVSAVAALAVALVVATPLQAALSAGPAGRTCRATAAVAAGQVLVDDEQRRAAEQAATRLAADGVPLSGAEALAEAAEYQYGTTFGVCIGAVTTRWLPLPVAAAAVLIFVFADVRVHLTRRAGKEPAEASRTS